MPDVPEGRSAFDKRVEKVEECDFKRDTKIVEVNHPCDDGLHMPKILS